MADEVYQFRFIVGLHLTYVYCNANHQSFENYPYPCSLTFSKKATSAKTNRNQEASCHRRHEVSFRKGAQPTKEDKTGLLRRRRRVTEPSALRQIVQTVLRRMESIFGVEE